MTSVRIPGKVLLTGEYAVLRGGTAVLAPVPRYLVVSDEGEASDTPVVREALDAPVEEIAAFESRHGRPVVSIDRSEMVHEGAKLGIGSSAAEAVGVVALRYERARVPWRDRRGDVLRAALDAHRRAQGGRGSGADVACCATEATIAFRLVDGRPVATPLDGEPPLPLALAWTGKSADTREYVDAFDAWHDAGGDGARRAVDDLVRLSDRTAAAWTADAGALRAALVCWHGAMAGIAAAANLDWEPAEALALREWAEARGGLAKPVGSGGGDVVLLIGDLPVEELPGPVVRVTAGR